MSGYKARVVNLSCCTLEGCDYGPEQHLVVKTKFVDLERGNAVAISYTWGDIARKRRKIGHYTDGSIATLTLGDDWRDEEDLSKVGKLHFNYLARIYTQPTNLDDSGRFNNLFRVLQDICANQGAETTPATPGYMWIDQLSIAQDTEEVKATLARIPDIYRSFNVVVLFPGAVCDCVKKAKSSLTQDNPESDRGPLKSLQHCVNSFSFGSWFTRLWPRQELFYAQRIQSRWTSEESWACPLNAPDVSRISAVARLRFLPYMARATIAKGHKNLPKKYVEPWLLSVWSIANSIFKSAITSIGYWATLSEARVKTGRSASDLGRLYILDLVNLLTGVPLARKILIEDAPEENRLAMFFVGLRQVVFEERSTTQKRDFVLAIWPDCPRYTIPDNHKEMNFVSLLEDAILQLERNWQISFVTMLPLGLFTPSPNTTRLLWRPSRGMFVSFKKSHDKLLQDGVEEDLMKSDSIFLYLALQLLQVADPTTTADIYGSVNDSSIHYDVEGLFMPSMVPVGALVSLRKVNTSPRTISSFDELFSQQPPKAIFDLLRVLVSTLPRLTALRVMYKLSRSAYDWNLGMEEQSLCQKYCLAWVGLLNAGKPLINNDSPDEGRSEEVKESTEDDSDGFDERYGDLSSIEKTTHHVARLLTFQLVCALLGADSSSMGQAKFSLMVDLGVNGLLQPRIGLSKFPRWNTMSAPTYTVVPLMYYSVRLVVGAGTILGGGLFENRTRGIQGLEVTCEGHERLRQGTIVSEYEVVGVWVPQKQVSAERIDFVTPLIESGFGSDSSQSS